MAFDMGTTCSDKRPEEARLFMALDATWPAKTYQTEGFFTFRDGAGGGSRVSAASWDGQDAPNEATLFKAEAFMQAMEQPRLFIIRESQAALDAALVVRGYQIKDPVWFYAMDLCEWDLPAASECFALWPPLASQAAIWADGGIGPARLEVMVRARGPKTTVFARQQDRIAATGFIACDGDIAMLHALETAQSARRQGVGRRVMWHMAHWAQAEGANWLTLVTTKANQAANGLYLSMGFEVVSAYHYRIHPEDA